MVPHNSLQYVPGPRTYPPGAIIQAALPKPPAPPKIPDGMDGFGGFGGGGGDDDDGYYDEDDIYGAFESGGPATIGDLFTNVGLLLQRGAAGLFAIWIVFVFLSCFCNCPGWLIQTPLADELGLGYDVVSYGPIFFNIILVLMMMVIMSVMAAFFLPMRTYMVAGPDAIAGLVPALKKIFPKLPGVLFFIFIGSLLTAIGLVLLLVPGFIIGSIVTLATYLYVTYDQTVPDAFKQAARMARNNIGILVVAILITFGVALFAGAFNYGCIAGVGLLGSYWSSLFIGIGLFISRFLVIFVVVLFWAATCITIETADTGVYIYKDEDLVDNGEVYYY